MDDFTAEQDRDLRAAELALGVLGGDELADAQALEASDPAFAALVAEWRERLAPMLDVAPATPPADGWERIDAALPANDDMPASAAARALDFWRSAAILAGSLAAVLVAAIIVRPPALFPEPQPVQVVVAPDLSATLTEDGGQSVMTISYDRATGRLLATPVSLRTDGLYPELWIIPEDGKARSLGILDAAASHWVEVAPHKRAHLHEGATFAVTLEPRGGAPGGVATGPVVVQGKIRTI